MSALTLGLDLGTSSVKIMAIDALAGVVAHASASFSTQSDTALKAEQNCADWLAATSQAFTALNARLLSIRGTSWTDQVTGMSLTGQLPTLVCVGPQGPTHPAITWKDGRADATTESILSPERRVEFYQRTGMPLDGRYLGPMWRHHRSLRSPSVRCILSAKDYLGLALTDQIATDPSTAAGYGAYDLDSNAFATDLIAQWQLPAEALPAVISAQSVLGPLSAAGARLCGLPAGIPVFLGAADSVCSAYAMSGLKQGEVCITMGSSTVILDAICQARRDPAVRYLLTPHVSHGWYGREMDLLATGTGHAWVSGLLGFRGLELDMAAAQSVPGANGVRFAPYLAGGEQGALWNPGLSGSLLGLNLRHDRRDIARAFLEGIYFEMRRCVEVLSETAPTEHVLVSGHFVEQPESLQLLSDVLNRSVQAVHIASPAAFGAALLAQSDSAPHQASRVNLRGGIIQPSAQANFYNHHYSTHLEQVAR